jgi:hypothetical protein
MKITTTCRFRLLESKLPSLRLALAEMRLPLTIICARYQMMASDTLESKAHELIGQLNPGKLAAVVHLLEVMVHDSEEDEEISAEEAAAVNRSKEWFKHNEGIPFEQVVTDLGFTMDQIRGNASFDAKTKDPAA